MRKPHLKSEQYSTITPSFTKYINKNKKLEIDVKIISNSNCIYKGEIFVTTLLLESLRHKAFLIIDSDKLVLSDDYENVYYLRELKDNPYHLFLQFIMVPDVVKPIIENHVFMITYDFSIGQWVILDLLSKEHFDELCSIKRSLAGNSMKQLNLFKNTVIAWVVILIFFIILCLMVFSF